MATLTFNDIFTLNGGELQEVLQQTDFYTLVDALATADGPMREKVFAGVSKRRTARLKTALENAGGLSREAGENARAEISSTITDVKHSYILPGFSEETTQRKVKTLADHIKEACAEEHGRLSLYGGQTASGIRDALLANSRDELARIRTINVHAKLLPVLLEFLEAGNIEELDVFCNDCTPNETAAVFPLFETLSGLKKLHIADLESIPESVGNLQSLTKFSAYIRGELMVLPESICGLKNLTALSVNSQDGAFKALPKNFADLQSLKELSLKWANDLGALSESVGALKNLESLSIYGEGCSGSIDWIGKLRSLTELSLKDCGIKSLPDAIGNLRSLRELNVMNCQIKALPETIGNLRSLTRLYLMTCGIKTLPDSIGNLEKLSELVIQDSSLERLPESIGNLISLTRLSLRGDHLHHTIASNEKLRGLPDGIGKLENLRELNINDYRSLERVPESIGGLRNLNYLVISGSLFLERLPESLGKLQSLTDLCLDDNKNLKALPDGIANIGSLKSVSLRGTGLSYVPPPASGPKGFIRGNKIAIIPKEASISYSGFVNHYFKMVETLIRFNEEARRPRETGDDFLSLLQDQMNAKADLEDILEDLEDDLFRRGIRLMLDGTKAENIRRILGLEIERELDFYKKKLMEIATEGAIGLQAEHATPKFIAIINFKVDIKDNPIDAAWEKYRAGDRDAFSAIDFAAAMLPEGERDEIAFIKKAVRMSKLAHKEGFLALENHIAAADDVFERGLCLIVDNDFHDFDAGQEYIAAVLDKMIRRESNPARKNIAAAKKEAILSIHAKEDTQAMIVKVLAYFDKTIAEAMNGALALEDLET